jgi:hypothetical protein
MGSEAQQVGQIAAGREWLNGFYRRYQAIGARIGEGPESAPPLPFERREQSQVKDVAHWAAGARRARSSG